ncbi:CidB/LrgB family autolysis modulator [Thermodesulforhabdus norvegica]|uniref:TIGR00659 family protein n=1 Tax=Thermodesulforhabdus norvegica TaxID=39841 RepID=A0A1I4W6K0_9BACT|nr:CidB/LrgB family autolysis modulator [Thermodesulforhabdus norvegica]SFN09093.1 TIGR00659 family protein [Thermodesulforhabdus norvegica]
MVNFLETHAFSVFITLAVFFFAQKIYLRFRYFWLNPVMLSIIFLILYLKVTGIPYKTYFEGGRIISFFLGPSVVALGVPLYLQLEEIKKRGTSILVSILVGSVSGIVSAAGLALILGGSREVIVSIAPKSVTTPIAMGISEKLGGIPSLTAAIVIATGVLGAVIGPAFLRLLGIKKGVAFGLAMGSASHGIGTARAIEEGEVEGAAGGLAICLNGVVTALLTPIFIKLFSL